MSYDGFVEYDLRGEDRVIISALTSSFFIQASFFIKAFFIKASSPDTAQEFAQPN